MSGRSSADVESITRGSSTFSAGGMIGVESGREHRVLELHALLASRQQLHAQMVRVRDLGPALEVLNLARLHQLAGPAGVLPDDAVLERAQLGQVELRLPEVDAPRLRLTRFVHENRRCAAAPLTGAAAIHAHAARVHFGIDERDAETEIGCVEDAAAYPPGPAPTTTSGQKSWDQMQPRRHESTKHARRRSHDLLPDSSRLRGQS